MAYSAVRLGWEAALRIFPDCRLTRCTVSNRVAYYQAEFSGVDHREASLIGLASWLWQQQSKRIAELEARVKELEGVAE